MNRALFAAAVFAAGSAFASEPAVAPVDARLGAEVDRICFARNINGWRELKGVDDAVLLETGVNTWYRVELIGACRARVFRGAEAIGIESRPGGGCVTRGDVIIVNDVGSIAHRCVISKINEWDEKAPAPGEDAQSGD